MNRQDILIKSNIRKKTEWTVFLDTVTMEHEFELNVTIYETSVDARTISFP